jgi:hypothetical protein
MVLKERRCGSEYRQEEDQKQKDSLFSFAGLFSDAGSASSLFFALYQFFLTRHPYISLEMMLPHPQTLCLI